MSRKFKFRIWDKESPQWVEWASFTHNTCIGINEIFEQKCYTFQQFTGFLDKNSEEVYEGDIVEYTEKLFEHGNAQKLVGVIKYDDYFCAFGIAATEDGDCMNYFTDMTIRDFKVIGNIYKNKELLKNENK